MDKALKVELVVNVDAKLVWLHPPKNTEEQIMREQADVMARKAAHSLNTAVQLLVLELLNAQRY